MAGKGRIRGSKNVNRNEVPMSVGSVTCEACGVSAPGRSDGKPMQHFDGRVEGAHRTQTYCNGKKS